MRFKRAVSITVDQFPKVFQLVLYRAVTGVIFYSLIYVILHLGLEPIVHSLQMQALQDLFSSLIVNITSGDGEKIVTFLAGFQDSLSAALSDLVHLIAAHSAGITIAALGIVLLMLLQRFINGIGNFAIASTINDRMSTYARTQFSAAYFKNLAKAALYEVIYAPLGLLYDGITLLACWLFFFFVPSLIPGYGIGTVLLAFSLTVAAVVLTQAVKLAFVCYWMPAVIKDGKRVTTAFKESICATRGYVRRFGSFVVACYLIVVVNLAFGVFTFGSGLLLSVPLSYIFLTVMQFVSYYEEGGNKYYLSRNVIAEPDEDVAAKDEDVRQ